MISSAVSGYGATDVADHMGTAAGPTSIRSRWARNSGRLSSMAGVWKPDWKPSR